MLTSRKQTQSYADKVKFLDSIPNINKFIFTPEEEDLIRKYFLLKGAIALNKVMPDKTSDQIRNKAYRMGIKRG